MGVFALLQENARGGDVFVCVGGVCINVLHWGAPT